MKIKGIAVMLIATLCIAKPVKAAQFSDMDRDRLMRIAMAEAEGEDTFGKAAVMEVVLNRVADSRYPENIHDVLFQDGQFTTVAKGGRYWTVKPNEDCAKALMLVEGNIDFVNGALFFNSGNSWIDADATFMFQLGNHKFYK